jgi:hypothetical protein
VAAHLRIVPMRNIGGASSSDSAAIEGRAMPVGKGQSGFAAALGVELAALCLCLIAAPAAKAEVIQINSDGGVVVHDHPEVTSLQGSIPILHAVKPSTRNGEIEGDRKGIGAAAAGAALSPDLVEAVAWRESRFRTDAVSPAGAIGEMQLMPGTAKALGVDPHDVRQNLSGGASYLAGLLKRYDGDMVHALAAYNAGPRAVDRYGGVPPYKETQAYVAAILDRLSQRAAAPER